MRERIHRAVLGENVTRDDIDDAMFEGGFQLTDIVPNGATHPYQMIYAAPHRDGLLYFIEDARLGLRYLQAVGASAESTLAFVRDHLDVASRDAIEAQLASPDDVHALARSLYTLALSATPETEREDGVALTAALSHESEIVRRAALIAASYAPLPSLRAPLARVAMSDPDRALRAAAAELSTSLFR